MRNTILATYEDKTRQMLAIKKPTKETVDIIHRILYPTRSNKFITIELDCGDLDNLINNSLAKPYTLNLSNGDVIVSNDQIQFIVKTEVNLLYTSIDLPLTSKIMDFFTQVYDTMLKFDIGSMTCNHRHSDGSLNITEKNKETNTVTCEICGETFNFLSDNCLKDVEVATDLFIDAINTIKILNPELTKAELVKLSNTMKSIYNVPILLKESLSKLDNI